MKFQQILSLYAVSLLNLKLKLMQKLNKESCDTLGNLLNPFIIALLDVF